MRGSSQKACTDRPWHWEYFTCHAVTAIIIPMVQLELELELRGDECRVPS